MENKKQTKPIICDACDCEGTEDNKIVTGSSEHDDGQWCESCLEHYQGECGNKPCGEECCKEECD